MNCRWVNQPPPHLLDLMLNSCFGTRFHSSFPENFTMSSRQFVSHLLFSGILSLRYPNTDQVRFSVRYDGWDNFPRVMMLILWWPGNMMSCLAHLTGGPIAIIFLLAMLSILPWGNCKTYSISCSWWILCVSKVWPFLEDPVSAISKHVYGTPIFNRNIWSTMLDLFIIYPNTVVWVISWDSSPPLTKWFSTLYPVMDIMLCLSFGRIYPWNMCLNTFSFPLFCLIWWSPFPFPLFYLIFLVIYMI